MENWLTGHEPRQRAIHQHRDFVESGQGAIELAVPAVAVVIDVRLEALIGRSCNFLAVISSGCGLARQTVNRAVSVPAHDAVCRQRKIEGQANDQEDGKPAVHVSSIGRQSEPCGAASSAFNEPPGVVCLEAF